MNQA
jgi:hypothetical protein